MRLDGGCISEIGPWSECSNQSEAEDLGEVILMPGLVNTHCHLDYTDFVGAIPSASSFTDWIRAIVDLKADVDDAALQASCFAVRNNALIMESPRSVILKPVGICCPICGRKRRCEWCRFSRLFCSNPRAMLSRN